MAEDVKVLTPKVRDYHLHLQQFKTARAAVKQHEANVIPGRMVMYRDFVNQHNAAGGKVNALIFVFLYREVVNGPLKKLAVHNVCSDKDSQSCDAWFVRDVMDHHFSGRSNVGEGLIAKQKAAAQLAGLQGLEIIQAGDHGPHFSSLNTFWNNTMLFTKYGVSLLDSFLCSYHAFNVCDAAGAVSKRLAGQELRAGTTTTHRTTMQSHAHMQYSLITSQGMPSMSTLSTSW